MFDLIVQALIGLLQAILGGTNGGWLGTLFAGLFGT